MLSPTRDTAPTSSLLQVDTGVREETAWANFLSQTRQLTSSHWSSQARWPRKQAGGQLEEQEGGKIEGGRQARLLR